MTAALNMVKHVMRRGSIYSSNATGESLERVSRLFEAIGKASGAAVPPHQDDGDVTSASFRVRESELKKVTDLAKDLHLLPGAIHRVAWKIGFDVLVAARRQIDAR